MPDLLRSIPPATTGLLYEVWVRRQVLAADRRGNFTVSLASPQEIAAHMAARATQAAAKVAAKSAPKKKVFREVQDGERLRL